MRWLLFSIRTLVAVEPSGWFRLAKFQWTAPMLKKRVLQTKPGLYFSNRNRNRPKIPKTYCCWLLFRTEIRSSPILPTWFFPTEHQLSFLVKLNSAQKIQVWVFCCDSNKRKQRKSAFSFDCSWLSNLTFFQTRGVISFLLT